MRRAGYLVASMLAALGCSRGAKQEIHPSAFGSITPLKLIAWAHACPVPLTVISETDARGAVESWAVECQEELGGDPELYWMPPPRGWGAEQRGWTVVANELFEIHAVTVVDSPDRFVARATAVIRTVMPPALHDAAVRSLTVPPAPGGYLASMSLEVKLPHPQDAPLMRRLDAGAVFPTTGICWDVSPIFFGI